MRKHMLSVLCLSMAGILTGYSKIKKEEISIILEQKVNNNIPASVLLDAGSLYHKETGYGLDFTDKTDISNENIENKPFYVSVNLPDGNYKVTVTLGNKKKSGNTTVRAESRRLFLENIKTDKNEFKTFSFVVNKRTPVINEKEYVRIKPREKSKLNWDDKLTIEFNGSSPQCKSIKIEKDTVAPTIFLAGNSTVVDQDEEPWASWGQMITRFMDERICVANYAESGESANTFIAAGRLKKALSQMKAGDYIFMEFGHNDQKQKGPGSGAYYSFATSLKTFIDEAKIRGAFPVLVTPTQRRTFKDGKIADSHEDFPEAIHWIAERENIPVIDLNEMTRTLFEALGSENSKKAFVHYPAGTFPNQAKPFADNTHFNPYGAYQIAKCVIEEIKRLNLPLADYIRDDVKGYNPSYPDNPETFHWDPSPFIELQKPDGN